MLRHQADVSAPVPMPVDRVDDSSVSNTSSAETVVWYYVTSSAWAAAVGQAAGTICTAKLTYSGVLNSMGTAVGSYNDTSLSFAAATRAAQKVSIPEDVFSRMVFMSPTDQKATVTLYLTTAGDYAIDHRRGQIWLNSKATVANDSATYQYATPLSGGSTGDKVDVIKFGGVAVLLDDAAFGIGTSPVLPAGFLADETGTDSVSEGDVGAARITLDRKQINSSEYLDDAAFTPAGSSSYVTVLGAIADETGADSVDEGDAGALRMTLTRFLKVSLGDLISGEDQTNNLIQTAEKPLAVSTYAPDQDTSAAAEASSVTKASAGVLYSFSATNSSGSNRYLQFFNSTTVPADATVPVLSFLVASGGSIHESFPMGRYFSTGIAWCWSSTAATKTVGSTDGIADVRYK